MARLLKEYKNLDRYRDRHGKMRYYLRKAGRKRIPITAPFGTLEFDQEYDDARRLSAVPLIPGQGATKRGTVNDLVTRYYASSDFKSLQPATQKLYRRHIESFRAVYGDTRVRAIRRSHFRGIRDDMWDRPGACRNLLKRLNTLFAFAVEIEMIEVSPMLNFKLPPPGDGFLPWSDEDIDTYLEYWAPGTRERLGLYLLLYTGQRRSDVVRMSDNDVREVTIAAVTYREIKVLQQKTGAELWIPLHRALAAELDLHPKGQEAFLIDRRTGKPLTPEGFANWIRESAKAPKRPAAFQGEPEADRQLIQGTRGPHGLRKASCRRLIEAGCDTELARAISGHADDGELKVYIKSVNQSKMARRAMQKLEAEEMDG
jgi:integrase